MSSIAAPQERYADLADVFLEEPEVTHKTSLSKGFGSNALKVRNKIFAMLVNDRLVVKLPKDRVNELVDQAAGEHFDPGHGRLMKEWLSLSSSSEEDWEVLAREAMAFVAP